jgi:hypothetical protein
LFTQYGIEQHFFTREPAMEMTDSFCVPFRPCAKHQLLKLRICLMPICRALSEQLLNVV